MILAFSPPSGTRRSTGLAVTLLLHVLLIVGWQYARRAPVPETDLSRRAIQWIDILPFKPATPPPDLPPPPPRVRESARPASVKPPPSAAPAPSSAAPVPPQPVPEAAPPAPPSAYEMLQQAKRSVGKIDQDLRKAYPGQPITAPVSNGATRLAKGMQDAADAAPNRWYQASKVTEIIDPGPYGRKRYRVVGAFKTYCITVESNHAPDGIDQMRKGIAHKVTNCDDDEQAPTKQKYN